jgi:hypothetical protein
MICKDKEKLNRNVKYHNFLKKSQDYFGTISTRKFFSAISSLITNATALKKQGKVQITNNFYLNKKYIVTTNYDNIFDNIFAPEEKFEIIYPHGTITLELTRKENKIDCIKHQISEIEEKLKNNNYIYLANIVYARNSKEYIINNDEDLRRENEKLKTIKSKTMLFIGYSFHQNDSHIIKNLLSNKNIKEWIICVVYHDWLKETERMSGTLKSQKEMSDRIKEVSKKYKLSLPNIKYFLIPGDLIFNKDHS